MYRDDSPTSPWRKSSYSGGGNDCVEIAFRDADAGLRDSKDLGAGALQLTLRTWAGLRAAARARLD